MLLDLLFVDQELVKSLNVFEDRDLILKNKEINLNKKIAAFKESAIQLRNLRIRFVVPKVPHARIRYLHFIK